MLKLTNLFHRKKAGLNPKLEVFFVVSAVVIFAAISLATITRSSIWFDESFSAYLIRFNYFDIAHYTALDVHPPFYYWLLKSWGLVFGTSDLALRSMSVFFAALSIVIAYYLVRKLFSQRAALWTLPLLTLMPFFVRYAQEARMYTLVTAIALAATYILTLAVEQKKLRWWIIYGIVISLGMWTHYFSALIWLAHWVWRLSQVYTPGIKIGVLRKRFFTKQWLIAHAVAIGLFAPWIPFLVFQVAVVQGMGFWIPPINPSTVPSYLSTILYYMTSNETSPWLTMALLLTIILWIIVTRRAYRTIESSKRRWFWLLSSIALIPVLLLLIGSLPPLQSAFIDRYLLASSVVLVMLTGVIIAYAPRDRSTQLLRNALLTLLVGSMIVGIANVYHLGNYNKFTGEQSAAKELMARISSVSAVGTEPVIADSPWLFYDAVHYSTTAHTVYFIDANTEYRYGSLEMLRTSDMFKIKDLDAFSSIHDLVWYIDTSKSDPVTPPNPKWRVEKVISINDPHSGNVAYHAVLYRTI